LKKKKTRHGGAGRENRVRVRRSQRNKKGLRGLDKNQISIWADRLPRKSSPAESDRACGGETEGQRSLKKRRREKKETDKAQRNVEMFLLGKRVTASARIASLGGDWKEKNFQRKGVDGDNNLYVGPNPNIGGARQRATSDKDPAEGQIHARRRLERESSKAAGGGGRRRKSILHRWIRPPSALGNERMMFKRRERKTLRKHAQGKERGKK